MNYDVLKFIPEIIKFDGAGLELLCAKILINNVPLIDIVQEYELKYAKKHNNKYLAGGYMYDHPEELYHRLNNYVKLFNYAPVLICECGCEGCADLTVVVEGSENAITWKNFDNPNKSNIDRPGGFCDYKDFPTFHFDKKQYYDEIDKLKKMKQ